MSQLHSAINFISKIYTTRLFQNGHAPAQDFELLPRFFSTKILKNTKKQTKKSYENIIFRSAKPTYLRSRA